MQRSVIRTLPGANRRSQRRDKDDTGASMVELALVLVLLVMLLVGTVSAPRSPSFEPR